MRVHIALPSNIVITGRTLKKLSQKSLKMLDILRKGWQATYVTIPDTPKIENKYAKFPIGNCHDITIFAVYIYKIVQ